MARNQFSRRVLARTVVQKLLAEPARQDYWIRALAAYLFEQKRVHEADLVLHDIEHELYEQDGQLLASVTSARPLNDTIRTELKKLLTSETGARSVSLSESIDAELVGGLVARTADAQLDTSVRTSLNRLATIE